MSSEPSDVSKVDGDGGGGTEEQASKLEEAFNVQRARMKELFLQKEEDLRQMVLEKEQLQSEVLGLRAELQQLETLSQNQKSDLLSLQLLVNETVEASSSGSEEVRKLRLRCAELEQQLAQLRHQQGLGVVDDVMSEGIDRARALWQDVSIAPATLVRSLARKLGADSEEQPNRKPAEDGDLQRYEMEISALKHKLRDTDTQLQEALKSKTANTTTTAAGDSRPEPEGARRCDMCANYEQQLVHEQKEAADAREKAAKWELALKLATEELEGARSIHDETIRAWHDERASSTATLEELRAAVDGARAALDRRAAAAHHATQGALQHVTTLTVERETLQRKLDSLERDNEMLMGRFIKKAEEMQNEVINLPDSIEELQLNTLELREKLICVQIGREEALSAEKELRAQLLEQGALFHKQESELAEARNALQRTREELERLSTEREQLQELGDKLRKSNDTIDSLLEDKKRMLNEQAELRSRVSALQQELDNSEAVQQDFVRLSQSLQVQLQRIREADTEVRWQDDDDVSSCPACHVALPNNKKKVHCRHCGRIFCGACASHSVASGPRRAPARVCAVCRTLLQPHAAPYFSTAPPHSPA